MRKIINSNSATYSIAGWGVAWLFLWICGTAAQAQYPLPSDSHFTESQAFDMPTSLYSPFLSLSNSTDYVTADPGIRLDFRVERTAASGGQYAFLVDDGTIDFRNATFTYDTYGSNTHSPNTIVFNVRGGSVYLGDNTYIDATALPYSGTALSTVTLYPDKQAYISVGDNAHITGTVFGAQDAVVRAGAGSMIEIGANAYIANLSTETNDSYGSRLAVLAVGEGVVNIGANAVIATHATAEDSSAVQAGAYGTPGTVTLGDNAVISAVGLEGHGLVAFWAGSSITAGKVDITTSGDSGYGVYAYQAGVTLGADSVIRTSGVGAFGVGILGGAYAEIGDRTAVLTTGTGGSGIYASQSEIVVGNDVFVHTTGASAIGLRSSSPGGLLTTGTGLTVISELRYGLYASAGGRLVVGEGADITADAMYGVYSANTGSSVEVAGQSVIRSTGSEGIAVYGLDGGAVTLADGVTVIATGNAGRGIYTQDGGTVAFGDITLSAAGAAYAIFAYDLGAKIEGDGVLDITGNVYANGTTGTGTVDLTFRNGSAFTGSAALTGAGAVNNLTFYGADSRWNMTADSGVTNFTLRDNFRHTLSAGTALDTVDTRISGGAALDVMGDLSVSGTLAGETGLPVGDLNLRGGTGTVTVNDLGEAGSTLDANFYIDSSTRGVASLDVGGTANMDSVVLTPTAWGWAQLASDEYTLVNNTNPRQGATNVVNKTLTAYDVLQDANRVYLKYNESGLTHRWDDPTVSYVFEGGSYQGMIKIENGTDGNLVAEFANLTAGLAPLLVEYLNNGLADSNLKFSVYGDSLLSLEGSGYLLDGTGFFAWDLTDFNAANNSDVMLLSLQVPEPATWLLLTLGLALLAIGRRPASFGASR